MWCRRTTARSNSSCAGAEQEIGNSTLPPVCVAWPSACALAAAAWIAAPSSAAAVIRNVRLMLMPSSPARGPDVDERRVGRLCRNMLRRQVRVPRQPPFARQNVHRLEEPLHPVERGLAFERRERAAARGACLPPPLRDRGHRRRDIPRLPEVESA